MNEGQIVVDVVYRLCGRRRGRWKVEIGRSSRTRIVEEGQVGRNNDKWSLERRMERKKTVRGSKDCRDDYVEVWKRLYEERGEEEGRKRRRRRRKSRKREEEEE